MQVELGRMWHMVAKSSLENKGLDLAISIIPRDVQIALNQIVKYAWTFLINIFSITQKKKSPAIWNHANTMIIHILIHKLIKLNF